MFTNTYLPHVGGVARSVQTFYEDLRDLGHEVLIIAPHFTGDQHIDTDQDTVFRVPAIQHFNGSDFSVRLPLPAVISDVVESFNPDIIHSHHPFLLGDTALRTARYRDLPLVFTNHTLYEQYTHYVPLDSRAMKRFVIHLTVRYANMCDYVIAPSESIKDLLWQRGVRKPMLEIPTGVDLTFFQQGRKDFFRQQYNIPSQAFVAGHVGRLAQEKNLDFLAQAMVRFIKQNLETYFLVVGSGPSTQTIQDIFQKEALGHRLILAGQKTGQDLRDAYKAMDVFVFASQSETQGMVVMEAMASGVPVIALDASGVREVVADGINGYLLPSEASHPDFARALEDLRHNSQQLSVFQEKALSTAQSFSRQQCAQRLAHLYEDLLGTSLEAKKEKPDKLVHWDTLLRGIKAEWELLSKKTTSVIHAMRDDFIAGEFPE
jgi:glycosyltransferase involved in cell wall biosynthesis